MSPAQDYHTDVEHTTTAPTDQPHTSEAASSSDVYYNPRLDPKNYLEGPLSPNASTRLRQMLARPGIVVRVAQPKALKECLLLKRANRLLLELLTVSALVAHSRLASTACIRGGTLFLALGSHT